MNVKVHLKILAFVIGVIPQARLLFAGARRLVASSWCESYVRAWVEVINPPSCELSGELCAPDYFIVAVLTGVFLFFAVFIWVLTYRYITDDD